MDLFSPLTLGDLDLANRVVMAPLTRTRSGQSGVPNDLNVEHYAQRAGAGLIITEGTWPSAEGRSYPGQPGIVTDEQEAGWKRVADAVHARGGRLVMQVMHGGRVSHTDITGTDRIVGPSAVAIEGETHVPDGKKAFPVPHELTVHELDDVRAEFVEASKRAVRAGLDGVEMHSANGYLLHEFLSPASNRRTDDFGGSPENRIRFVVSVVEAVAASVGAGRVGIRISPSHNIQDVAETDADDVQATYSGLMKALAPLGLAYVSILHADPTGDFIQGLRRDFGGGFIVNSGFSHVTTREEAISLVEGAHADAVAVGRAIIANPDLVERWRTSAPENELDPTTLYGATAKGYIDYPALGA
ncbi:alkene reductase [Frondihabitans australicus]|uniref:2,4-dienoyl-CoA reductase-like NADH-dependent reductase (Old Yellow Enzyme family) n=1 Tax=Frondihabitans australicus TaxID=386892 RepID=A0A495IHY9_9MICO|nr:alkene reductase [Frondihabitans australicus]RKR74921.1 2,4-dienoyl-CoA reductase-like NADH-dependent reductase (Old Yellow Enzyme family) [Frondihabitans australicus]